MSVYFIKVGRYIKVGYSQTPERRCAALWKSSARYGRPWDLSVTEPRELLLTIPGSKNDEALCHAALDDFAAGCEWFIDEPQVREFMTKASRGAYPKTRRPAGPFEPVSHEQMLPERRAELDRMTARAMR